MPPAVPPENSQLSALPAWLLDASLPVQYEVAEAAAAPFAGVPAAELQSYEPLLGSPWELAMRMHDS